MHVHMFSPAEYCQQYGATLYDTALNPTPATASSRKGILTASADVSSTVGETQGGRATPGRFNPQQRVHIFSRKADELDDEEEELIRVYAAAATDKTSSKRKN